MVEFARDFNEFPDAMWMVTRTDVGLVRDGNEDYLVADAESGFAVLADGMGGLAAGEVASRDAAGVVADVLKERRHRKWARIEGAIRAADQAIFERNIARAPERPMGTTLIVWARTGDDTALVAHVGDSRAYWFDGDYLQRLTSDHSVVQDMVNQGMISEREAHRAPNRHVLTQAIGLGETLEVDTTEFAFGAGDRFLLCSDGLSDMVPHDELQHLFRQRLALDVLADALVRAALDAGGHDNVSLILIEV